MKTTTLSKKAVIAGLRGEIRMYRDSYVHRSGPHKGRVIDAGALRTIAVLEAAIMYVKACR